MSTPAPESGLYILHGKPQKPKRRAKFATLAVAVPVGFIAGALLGAGTVKLWTREAPTPAPIEAPLAIPHAEATSPRPAPIEAPLAMPHAEATPPPRAPTEAPLAIPHAEVTPPPPAPVPSPHALINQWWQTHRRDPAPFQAKGESRRLPPQSPRNHFRNGRDAQRDETSRLNSLQLP
jgi:hypothetical protein